MKTRFPFALAGIASALLCASASAQTPNPFCIGNPCLGDAPPAIPPAGWTITPGVAQDGRGFAYFNEQHQLVRTCLQCKDCRVSVSYAYAGTGAWTIQGGPPAGNTSCGYSYCNGNVGPTSGDVTLVAGCNGQDTYWFTSDGQQGIAVLVCACNN